jgi:hypothetical protein
MIVAKVFLGLLYFTSHAMAATLSTILMDMILSQLKSRRTADVCITPST